MTDIEFVPKPLVKEWDDQVRMLVENVETKLDTRLDGVEQRVGRLEYDRIHYEGRIDERIAKLVEQMCANNDRMVGAIESLANKISPVWDALFGSPEDRKKNVEAIQSTAASKKKWEDYKDVAIKAVIGVAAVAIAGVAWEATKKAFRDTPSATASVTVPSQSTTVIAPPQTQSAPR